ncbi:MAG: FtsX-like permease family protein [Verrucomicrobia bacterium]|nr:MAG: FtsX-like permease family protein [Verrucomicrobiota bacterium]
MIFNAFIIALREIRRNVTRSFLTVVGIVIGVAAVVTMVTLGQGATDAVRAQIANMGSNLLIIRPGQNWWSKGVTLLKISDVEKVKEQVTGIRLTAPLIETNVAAMAGQRVRFTSIQGTTPDYFEISNWQLSSGRFFNELEVTQGAGVAVIGETVRKELFGRMENPIGKKIRLDKMAVEVIGITKAKGQGGFGDDLDDNIIIPYTSMQRRLTGKTSENSINQIMISGENGYPTARILADAVLLMRERRGLSGNEENDFSVFDSLQIAETLTATTRILTSLLGAVAGVSLLVGGIGIMNIMLVSVTERTREIGIRMAIGARARDVLLQFLVEAITLSCVGGIIGIVFAYGLCDFLSTRVGAPFVFDAKVNAMAFIFSAGIGVLFGFMPARRAAQLDPIDALRHE